MSESDDAPESKWIGPAKFFWEMAKAVVLGLAALFSMWSNQNAEEARKEAELAKHAAERQAHLEQLSLEVYRAVEKALAADAKAQRAAAALVNGLITSSPVLRDGLLRALAAGTSDQALSRDLDKVKEFEAEEDPYDAPRQQQQQKPQGTADKRSSWSLHFVASAHAQSAASLLKDYRIDVFYCEDQQESVTNTRKRRAENAAAQLNKDPARPQVRVRLLPVLIQARPDYRSARDEVRYDEQLGELAPARHIATLVNIPQDHLLRVRERETPGYLSVWYCGS